MYYGFIYFHVGLYSSWGCWGVLRFNRVRTSVPHFISIQDPS